MNVATQQCLSSVRVGEPQVHRNVVIFPLLTPKNGERRWLTLGEALEQNLILVTEVSQGGNVPELKVQVWHRGHL
jgi:hypothetical protein